MLLGKSGGAFANFCYWGSRSYFANCRRKTCPKTRENAGITSFSRYAAKVGELQLWARVGVRGFLPRENFYIFSPFFSANFFKGKSLRGRNCYPPPLPPWIRPSPSRGPGDRVRGGGLGGR